MDMYVAAYKIPFGFVNVAFLLVKASLGTEE